MVSCLAPSSLHEYNTAQSLSPGKKKIYYIIYLLANLHFKGSKSPQSNAPVPPELFSQTGLGAAVGCITPLDQPGGGETTDCGASGGASAAGVCSCGC